MAKFCTKCGKKLEEGKACDCSKTSTPKTVASTETKIDIKESFMDCVNVFKKIFTKPLDAIKEFVCENKFVAGIIMVVLAALSSGLYKIATLKSMYSSTSAESFGMDDLSSLFETALSGGSLTAEPEYLKEFFTTFGTSLVEYALIVLLGYVIISKLFKGTASWKHMITAVAISLSIVLVGNVLNSVIVFIDGDFIANIRSYISSFASILSILILCGAVKEVAGIDKNKVYVGIASMSVFATVVIDVAKKIFE